MKITILGNGGAINDGLPYNAFIVDDCFLIESPPDIIRSIFRENLDIRNIKAIYISHFHADHYFGLPFLFLRLFFEESKNRIVVVGPAEIEEKVKEICNIAFGTNHPMQKWIEKYTTFKEIENGKEIEVGPNFIVRPIKMFHFIETYGFILESEGKRFAYLADTYWEDRLLDFIGDVGTIIVDLNGENTDKTKVHISEDDLITHALPKIKDGVKFYGTHLRNNKMPKRKRIQYLKFGDKIYI